MRLVLHLKKWPAIWFCVLVRFLQFKQLLMYNLHLRMLLLVINVLRGIVSIEILFFIEQFISVTDRI